MTRSDPARAAAPRTRWTVLAALVVLGAAVIGVLDYHSSGASPSSVAAPATVQPIAHRPQLSPPRESGSAPGAADGVVPNGPAGEADGVVPAGVTVFDNHYPAVTKLNPALLGALRRAATDAAGSGITLYVNSGWRSAKYQEQLLQEAIAKYGSEKAAARWVATPTTSAHVSGNAVDLGPSNATKWLSEHGAAYGLCQIYRNETWHYELRPEAIEQGCPAMYADPTQDPRMQQ